MVRRPLASSLSAIAAIVGPTAASHDLHPLFLRLLRDPDPHVHVAAADGAADVYSLLLPEDQSVLMEELVSVCRDRARPLPIHASLATYGHVHPLSYTSSFTYPH